jgi:hypothetical protein
MRQPRTLCCFYLYYLLEDYHNSKKNLQLQHFYKALIVLESREIFSTKNQKTVYIRQLNDYFLQESIIKKV